MKNIGWKAIQERKVEKLIHKALSDLQVLTSAYMGERAVARGDYIPHEEIWKKFKDKYKFKLTEAEKRKMKRGIKELLAESKEHQHADLLASYFTFLLENREEVYKRPLPKRFPSPLPNHL